MLGLPVRVPLARGFRVSSVQGQSGLAYLDAEAVGVLQLPLSGVVDGGHGAAQDAHAAAFVVLGGVSDDHSDTGDLGEPAAATARVDPT